MHFTVHKKKTSIPTVNDDQRWYPNETIKDMAPRFERNKSICLAFSS